MEFALVFPIFLVFILGLIELGRGFMVAHLLSNAARSGCRTGILANKTTTDITTAVNNSLAAQGVSGQNTTVKVNGLVADASTAQSGDQITVVVSIPAANATWLPVAYFLTGNLSGEYALRRE